MTAPRQPTLSVVVPVFNQAASIVANLEVIRERLAATLGDDFEIVVVSDGSIDATEEELVAEAPDGAFRVFHYDRNMGKGYAIKVGALEAVGRWVGFVDADLDLNPEDLAKYVAYAEAHELDFAIGSKRHPDSLVQYPPIRVAASWLFQQLVRLLFRLNVRDTQVGLKVFRREVAEQVLPFLLVKRFAFDIELLAVGRAFGFDRIAEMPVRLDYRFTGSGVRSRAVIRALVDTAAIFYRLRILHYYQRRRALGGAYAWSRPRGELPIVSVLLAEGARFREFDGMGVEVIELPDMSVATIRHAAAGAQGEIVALLERRARAAANWLSATVPFFVRNEIIAVVFPKVAPLGIDRRTRAAAAVSESRIGAGLGYFRYTPGNLRYVDDFPTRSLVARRADLVALDDDTEVLEIVAALAARGNVLYTPETVAVLAPPPLFLPHLRTLMFRGRIAVRSQRRGSGSRMQAFALLGLPSLVVALVVLAIAAGSPFATVLEVVTAVYLASVAVASLAAALRYQSIGVGVLTAAAIPASHAAWIAGAAREATRPR
jgi:glycosyltransferase involved in cell wall biosynthesis